MNFFNDKLFKTNKDFWFMALLLLYLTPVLGFITVLISTPVLIRFLRRINLVVKDQNKEDKPLIPISGGLSVVAGVLIGLMLASVDFVYINQIMTSPYLLVNDDEISSISVPLDPTVTCSLWDIAYPMECL